MSTEGRTTTSESRNADERALGELDVESYGVYPERDVATTGRLAADHFVAVFASRSGWG